MSVSRTSIQLPERYRPLRHIANGGMAAVWAAHDTLLDREVAIKLLAPHLAESERARERFQREARLAAGLSAHPHAVTIYDVGECYGRSFIVMESLPGGSLADRLREGGRVPRDDALEWLGQAAAALDAAHRRGVIHRDVKPGNMLFDEHRRLVLADFGIARLAYDPTVTTTGEVLGTAAYVSPEQANGDPATAASDLYSLAVVAYELLTGTRPFRSEHFAATARQHIEMAPEPPSSREPSLPRAVDPVLLRALAKDPSDRYPTATVFVDALDSALDVAPAALGDTQTVPLAGPFTGTAPSSDRLRGASAPAPPARQAAARSPRRPRRAALALAGLALLVVVGLVFALTSSGGDELQAKGVVGKESRKQRKSRDSASSGADTPTRTSTSGSSGASSDGGTSTGDTSGGGDSSGSTSTGDTAGGNSSSGGSDSAGGASSGGTSSSGGGESAAALNQQGFGLMNQGRYDAAVPVLQRSVKACGNDPQDLTCAYAMYNLGRSLRLAGRPGDAIPVLQRRLQNSDQKATVQSELDQARAAAGRG